MKLQTILPVLAATLALQACVINADSHTRRTGKYVSATTLAQIQPGRDQSFVLAVLGEPSTKSKLGDGSEIWKWTYREHQSKSAAVIFLVNRDSSTETEGATYVELKDGLVVKSWQD